MVQHGRLKKRRAGRIGRTSIKRTQAKTKHPRNQIPKALKEHWDATKSSSWNYANLGIVKDPNQHRSVQKTPLPSTPALVELFDVPESDKPSRRSQFPLSQEEEEYMVKCMKKHGDDYKRMFRDTKTNDMQHTEQKLRKWGSRFLLLTPEQRRCEIPEKVKHLVFRDGE